MDDEGNPISEDGSAPDGSRKRFKSEVVKKVSGDDIFCHCIC